MKSARETLDIVNAYQSVGTYRGAAVLCGTTPKTVKRVLERRARGQVGRRPAREPLAAEVTQLLEERIRQTDGRISAKRLLPVAQAAGYEGSLRTLQRVVRPLKAAWKLRRRTYRPWIPTPGQYLLVDWTTEGGWQLFGAVLAWSHYRFVRFGPDQTRATTEAFLAECFEELGGVPEVVLTDRMACLKAGIVANVVVPHPDYVAFATHYGFRPDFCEGHDPESKGMVEALMGYAQRDLLVPALMEHLAEGGWADEREANQAARAWDTEVNGRLHQEIQAVPSERLVIERRVLRPLPSLRAPRPAGESRKVDRLGMVRFGSGRYAVASTLVGQRVEVRVEAGYLLLTQQGIQVARHLLVAPGEVALGTFANAERQPTRGVRPRTATEVAFLALGSTAEAFLRAAAAAGTMRLERELRQLVDLAAAWGPMALTAALERAVRYRRFKAADVRAILAAGPGVPAPTAAGILLTDLDLPPVPERPLHAYGLAELGVHP